MGNFSFALVKEILVDSTILFPYINWDDELEMTFIGLTGTLEAHGNTSHVSLKFQSEDFSPHYKLLRSNPFTLYR